MTTEFKNCLHIGILGAMKEEIGEVVDHLNNIYKKKFGDLTIISGELLLKKNQTKKIYLSIAWSGWGKVSSSRAATRLIGTQYKNNNIDLILFTGVAGSLCSELNQWDIIIPNEVIQHDLDARPIFKQFYIPSLNKDLLYPNKGWFNC